MAAGTYNFIIEKGTTFTRTVTWTDSEGDPIDLTGYTARMQGRASMDSTTTLFSLTSPSTGISIPTPANGALIITLTDTQTTNLPCGGVHDLELVSPSGTVTRLFQGSFDISNEVTRP